MDQRDFEEFQREFQRRMRAFPMRTVVRVAVIVLVVVLVLWAALSSYYVVDTDEVGVLQRFGAYVDPPLQSGLHVKLPFGIDRVDPVKVDRVQTLTFGFRTAGSGRALGHTGQFAAESLMLTGDQNVVDVEWIVQYKVKNAPNWLFRIKNPVETIRDVSEAATRLVVGDSSATEVLTARRRQIAGDVKRKMQEVLDRYESGIDIHAVELQNIVPPTQAVQDSYNEVNRARQEKDTTINQAKKEYEKAIPEAEGQKQKIIQEAEGYKIKRVNEARGDVAKFVKLLEEYQNSKEVTRQRLYLEAIEEVLPRLTRVFVLDEKRGAPLQLLDLDTAGATGRRRDPADTTSDRGRR